MPGLIKSPDVDVEIIDRDREPRDEPRLEDHTGRVGVGCLRREIGIAAEQARYTGWPGWRMLPYCAAVTPVSWHWASVAVGTRAGAGIVVPAERDRLRSEQLDHVGRSDRAVVAGRGTRMSRIGANSSHSL